MYATIETRIVKGNIIPLEPGRIPSSGKALLTIISSNRKKPEWKKISACLGNFTPSIDPSKWQKETRKSWNSRVCGI